MALEYASIDYLFYPLLDEETIRSGIIPYANINGRESWLLGILKSGRFSDFGGSCLITAGELPFECAVREVDEESNGLLTEIVTTRLTNAFNESHLKEQPPQGVHIWRWVNLKRPTQIDYLIFLEVDYEPLANIHDQFEGNEENVSLDWYDREELMEQASIDDFNTSIQKYMRRFGIKK